MRLTNDEAPIAVVNFTQIFRGSFQACYLGFKISHQYQGQGFMQEAIAAAMEYMFVEKGIHRIMANYMPSNTRSASLLSRLGFVKEGYAEGYLSINGRWQDHILTALNREQWERGGIPSSNAHVKFAAERSRKSHAS